MAWFQYSISHTTYEALADLKSVPGLLIRDRSINAHDNSGWLVEQILTKHGIHFSARLMTPDFKQLEKIEDLCKVGLREWVPDFMTPYQKEAVLALGHKSGHLWHAAGCLAGDTEIEIRIGNAAPERLNIAEIVHRFNGGLYRSEDPHDHRWYVWPKGIPVYARSVDEATGRIDWNRITAAVESGRQTILQLRADGFEIEATEDHKFLTPAGWKPLKKLAEGDEICVEAWVAAQTGLWDEHALMVPVKVESIERRGAVADTYDLTMEGPHNNFVANGIIVHNSGKTLTSTAWSLAWPGNTVVTTRAGVRRNYAREIERFTTHRAYVIEEKKDCDLAKIEDSEALYVVLGWEMLPDCLDTLIKWKPANWIADECFPGETLVATPDGDRRIDSILPGDKVLSLDEQQRVCERAVTRVLAKRLTVPLLRVTHDAGSFVCTENHKVWTEEDGYVEAGRLASHHHLRVVRREDGHVLAGSAVSSPAWREWARLDEATGDRAGLVSIAGAGVFRWGANRDEHGAWRSSLLARLGTTGEEGGSRAGCPQGQAVGGSRVVGVAREERGCVDELARDAGAYPVVFDLEVEDTHRYFASGVLVSNCHKAKSHRRFGAVPKEDGRLSFEPLANIGHAAYRLSRAARHRLAATATPIKDRVRDLWAQLDLIHPDAWGPFYREDRTSFATRYCAARRGSFGGIETTGSSNLDELWDRVSIVVDQVPHSVTHRSLPPKRRLVTYVTQNDQNAATGFAKVYKEAAKGGRGTLLEAKLMEAAAKKRKFVLELVEEAVENKQKVVIFTGRREDCDKLAAEITKAVGKEAKVFSGHGGTPAKVRDQIQQDYMAAEAPAILVGTGDAWGEGYNLQDSDLHLIVMLPYTPGQIIQWEGRTNRHGQKRPVLVQYLVAEGTVDEHVAQLLLDKLPAVERVAGDDSVDGFSDQLRGSDNADAIIESILSKLGI